MAVSPKAYETVGKALGLSAQKLTEEVGKALTKLHQEVILDPDSISKARKRYNTSINKALKEWNKRWKDWADRDLAEAYLRGTEYTDEEIKRLKLKRNPDGTVSPDQPLTTKYPKAPSGGKIPSSTKQVLNPILHHLTFYNVFRRAAYHSLEGTHLQILRASKDLYRDVAVQAGDKMFKESDIFTRRQLSQEMLGDFAKRGINCITYKNGRKVSIEAYAEMVGRTMSAHAAVQASLNRFEEYGYNLVRVSSHFRACPLCVPWEGKILRTSDQDPMGLEALAEPAPAPAPAPALSPSSPLPSGVDELLAREYDSTYLTQSSREIFAKMKPKYEQEYSDKLTSRDLESLRHYQETGYPTMNGWCRGRIEEISSRDRQHIDTLSEAIKKAIIKDDLLCVRGTTTSLLGETGWDGLKVHDVIKEKGFMSVSLREKVAKSTLFADKGERTIIAYLKVPKGTPGIMVDVAVNSPFESEFLLGPGTKIMVTKKEIKDGKKILEGLVLP